MYVKKLDIVDNLCLKLFMSVSAISPLALILSLEGRGQGDGEKDNLNSHDASYISLKSTTEISVFCEGG